MHALDIPFVGWGVEMNTPIRPFTTDGCSGGMSPLWRLVARRPPPWEGCCTSHDEAYWRGGSSAMRLVADRALAECVARAGYPRVARTMFVAVRLGGVAWLPTPWRWGYGYPFRSP